MYEKENLVKSIVAPLPRRYSPVRDAPIQIRRSVSPMRVGSPMRSPGRPDFHHATFYDNRYSSNLPYATDLTRSFNNPPLMPLTGDFRYDLAGPRYPIIGNLKKPS